MTYPDTLMPTPLAPLYGDGVVEWMDVFGFAVPVTWGEPEAEYDAIRNHVAVIEFSMLLKFDVTGPGAADCVNRVFSRDVTAMKAGRVAYGVVVTPEGHMVDDCTVFYHSPERVMVMGANPRLGDDLLLAAGPGVTVRECRADYAQISVQGPKSRAILQELCADDLSNAALPYYDFRTEVTIVGISMQISRLGFTRELGYELLLPAAGTPDLWAALTAAGPKYGLRSVGGAGLMMARIEAGLIMGGLDYDETSTPWECRMGWAVDLTKPDFQGKVALAASKGSAQWTLVSIAFPIGTEGLDGAEIKVGGSLAGTISMAIPSPALDGRVLALARISKAHASIGTSVSARGYSGTVVKMPVYDPERKRARG
jgi:aminomethyltransferase